MSRICMSILITIMILGTADIALSQYAPGAQFDLGVGESKIVEGTDIEVGFDAILADSRCPIGLLCIWPGDAVAQIWADAPSTGKSTAELHTYNDFQNEFTYHNHRITLIKVVPYPFHETPIDPDSYVVTLVVTAVSSPVENTTWSRIKALYK